MMKKQLLWGSAAWLLLALPAWAGAVYECRDGEGRTVYVQNQNAARNCKKADIGRIGAYSHSPGRYTAPAAAAPAVPAAEAAESAADSAEMQAKRREAQQQLDAAQQALDEGRQVRYGNERNYARYQERIRGLEDAVSKAQKQLNELNRTSRPAAQPSR